MTDLHIPVLLTEVLEALGPRDGETYIDGTFGAGGYSRAILRAANCHVIGIDRDPVALEIGRAAATDFKGRLNLVDGTYSDLDQVSAQPVQGVVLDIGVSSMQIDDPARGFSFQSDGPLDMRMASDGPTAADIVNGAEHGVLASIFSALGEERHAGRIASAICKRRDDKPFRTTRDLAGLLEAMAPPRRRPGDIHPATRVFQGLRIAVNRELDELVCGLEAAERALDEGGRLVVVSFHSLEDRIVKRFLRDADVQAAGSRHQPEAISQPATFTTLTRKAVRPSDDEIRANPRARSSRLRAAIRTGETARGASKALWRLTGPDNIRVGAGT